MAPNTTTTTTTATVPDDDVRGGETESEDWTLLHRCLGHMSYKRIDQLLDGNSTGLPTPKRQRIHPKAERVYNVYLASKIKELFNKKTNKREGKKV